MNMILQRGWFCFSLCLSFVIVLLLGYSLIGAQDLSLAERRIPVTMDPSNRRLTTYEQYLEKLGPPTPFFIEKIYQTNRQEREPGKSANKVLVIVNSTIQDSIQGSLNQYAADMEKTGYTVSLWATSGGTPASIKAHIVSEAAGLAGVVIIGDIPVPWFEIYYDFYTDDDGDGLVDEDPIDGSDNDGDGQTDEDPPYDNDGDGQFNEDHLDDIDDDGDGLYDEDTYDGSHAEFPCDLYYMDLDGTWEDYDTDGRLDVHRDGAGDMGPEIWVGRLTASPLNLGGANEVDLLNNYFTKNHSYRTGSLSCTNRALVYVDDDWVPWADGYNADVQLAYPTTVLIKEEGQTCRDDYRDVRLVADYEWMHVMLHSSWVEHYFKVYGAWEMEDPWTYATVSNADVQGIDPVALFYNLFACSNCRYVEQNYMGGWYTFVDQRGLGAVGATKTGSMLDFDEFYGPLGGGACLGEAYRQWYEYEASYEIWKRQWFWGMTLLGDPTIRGGTPPLAISDLSVDLAKDDLVLNWSPVSQDTNGSSITVDLYVVYRDTSHALGPDSEVLDLTTSAGYVDSSGAVGNLTTHYFYMVTAISGGKESGSSNEVGEFDREVITAGP